MKRSESIIEDDYKERCYICMEFCETDVHHIFHGSRRKAADMYGLTVHLCRNCHAALHDKGRHDESLKALGQKAFEKRYGHDLFMKVFGKNYLEDENETLQKAGSNGNV